MRCPGHTSRDLRHGPPHGGEDSGLCARFAPRSAARGRVFPGRTRSRSSPEAHKSQFAPQPSERWMKSGVVCLFHFATACLRMRLPRSRESAFRLRGTQAAICAIFSRRWLKSRLVCLWALLRSCARRSQLVFATFLGGNPELCVNEALEDAAPDVGRIKALYYSFV